MTHPKCEAPPGNHPQGSASYQVQAWWQDNSEDSPNGPLRQISPMVAAELRQIWWRAASSGYRLPAERGLILFENTYPRIPGDSGNSALRAC